MKMYLPTGISSYKKLRTEDYYTVDKTLMIQEFLERRSEVTLITRPRRFGKTMNMSMMAEFFDITKDSKSLFEGLAIMDTQYAKEMNHYPTLFISFANARGSLKNLVKDIKQQILQLYDKNQNCLSNINMFEKPIYDVIWEGLTHLNDGDLDSVSNSLSFLMKKMGQYYQKKVILLLDE